jgi:NADPH-dependent curcumin reductase CurA
MEINNRTVRLLERPFGFPKKNIWSFNEENFDLDLKKNELLVKNEYISIDPAMRGWLNKGKSYISPVSIGDVMRAGTIGVVVRSKNNFFKVGDYVSGWGGVQEYNINDGKNFNIINDKKINIKSYLSVLGMTGLTAYFGILRVGEIKKNDTVVVSAAAGAVGSVVGQIAKIKGCKVIGIAGGSKKCDYVKNILKFDDCIDYKSNNFFTNLKKSCKEGVDVYFDNVGGTILNQIMMFISKGARIVICGAISQYNQKPTGPNNYLSLLVNRATMKGMVVFDYVDDYELAIKEMRKWILDKKLTTSEDIYEGIENFHEIFLKLFSGEKIGKLILKV